MAPTSLDGFLRWRLDLELSQQDSKAQEQWLHIHTPNIS